MIQRARMLFLLCGVVAASAAAGPALSDQAVVDEVAHEAMGHGALPGMSVAVLRADRLAYSAGFGEAEIDNHVPASAATVYRVNSITKAFTATAVLQLAEQGKLRLEDPLSKFLPEFTRPGHDPTLHQLLDHSGGLTSYGGPSFHRNIRLDLDARQWLESINDDHLYAYTPGHDWRYSNAGYDLLGLVVAQVAGLPFAQYLQAHVFAPAGMASTRLCNTAAVVPNRAFSYTRDGSGWVHAESWGTYGDASDRVCSNVRDLAAFWTALGSGRLLGAGSLAAMRDRSRLDQGTRYGYGLGTRLGELDGKALVAYTGDGESWTSALVGAPGLHLAVVVLTNAEAPDRHARRIAVEILRRLAGLPQPVARDRTVEPALLRELPGTWGSDSPALISVRDAHIALKPLAAPGDPITLLYLGHGTFRLPADSPAPDLSLAFDTAHRPHAVEAFNNGIFEELHLKQPR